MPCGATEFSECAERAWLADTYDATADLSARKVKGSPFDNYIEAAFWGRPASLERISSERYVRCFVRGAVISSTASGLGAKPGAEIGQGGRASRDRR